jgi:hypothetical protein
MNLPRFFLKLLTDLVIDQLTASTFRLARRVFDVVSYASDLAALGISTIPEWNEKSVRVFHIAGLTHVGKKRFELLRPLSASRRDMPKRRDVQVSRVSDSTTI